MMRVFWVFLLLTSVGCVSFQQHENLKSDLFRVQKRVLHLEEQQGVEGGDIDGVRQQVASGDTKLQELEDALRMVQGELDTLKVAVRKGYVPGELADETSLYARVAKLETQKAVAAKQETVTPKKTEKKEIVEQQKLNYAQINQAFHDKQYDLVIQNAPRYFNGSHAKGSRYLVAESHYQKGRWSKAALGFNELLEMKPSDKVLPHVRMRMGNCFEKMGKMDAAQVYYQELMQLHPKSKEAKLAKKSLSRLNKTKKV